MPEAPWRPAAGGRPPLAADRSHESADAHRHRRSGPAQNGSPSAIRRRASAPSASPEELRLAADRWAAMIIDAYLSELRAAAKECEEEPS